MSANPPPASTEAWREVRGTGGQGEAGTDRKRSAFRTLVDLRAETAAILLAFRGPVAEPVGQPGSGQEDEGGDFEDENHGGVRRAV